MDNAVVIGAGPGGITLALAMRSAGIECTVYERDDEPDSREGHYISLGTNGLNALRAIDVSVSGIAIPRLLAYSGSGMPLGELYNGPADRTAPPAILVGRLAYERELYEIALARGVRFVHNKELLSYKETGHGVTALFTDGTSAEGDVLVGADGVHSATRRALFPEAPGAVYTGMLGIGGRSHSPRLNPTPEAVVCMFGWEAFFSYHVDAVGEIHWMAFAPRQHPLRQGELASTSTEEWRTWLLTLFQRDMTAVQEVLEHSRGPMDVYPVYDVQGVPAWHRGRVALIGDAARTAPPRIGVGASLAMEDGVVLARCLRDIPDPVQAVRAYQSLREVRVRRVVRWGRLYARPPKVSSALGMRLREIAVPPLLRLVPSISSMDWIYGHRVSWDKG